MVDNKSLLEKITVTMDLLEGLDGKPISWFFCFGTMLEYLADKTFSLDYDIDIGVFYDQCDSDVLINTFKSEGYKAEIKIINDVSKRPLNLHFVPLDNWLENSPTLDIYFWYYHKGVYYHTYDVYKKGKKIPEKYIFKGVDATWLKPKKIDVENQKKIGMPTRRDMMRDDGIWRMPIFGESSSYEMRIPFKCGSLLDEWYTPTWHWRKNYKGQSLCRKEWQKTLKSCKDWKHVL